MIKIAKMNVEYVDHMGSDLSVVNAARVSFDKISKKLNGKDKKLIKYLSDHNHWTPFGHTSLSLRIKAPIFVARQLVKHQVGGVWNEISRRYVDSEPEIYQIKEFRKKSPDKKQGSLSELIEKNEIVSNIHAYFSKTAIQHYQYLLREGVCPEQARACLPLNTMTEWIWTGSVAFFSRVCNLRLKPDTQKETQEIAQKIFEIMKEYFPLSTDALVKE
jgi:thymidylate synthase (FAD)